MAEQENKNIVDLPNLAKIFNALRRGRHISLTDGQLYTDLNAHADDFKRIFAQLGFTMIRHPRDFFYFIDRSNFSESAARISLFMFILIENLADKGDSIEETIMSRRFNYSELPHLTGERYRNMMREAGILDMSDIENLTRSMEKFRFLERMPDNTFTFRTPAYRFLDICIDMAPDSNEIQTENSEAATEPDKQQ